MMLTDTQAAVKDAVRAFSQERIRPRSTAFETAKGFPPDLFVEMADLGLMGMTAPEDVGGADVHVCHIYEGTSDIQRMVIARAL